MIQGQEMHAWAHDLWPMNRSLTGPGNRETLAYLKELLPGLNIKSEKSGTRVCDWVIPDEWVCHEAWIMTPEGRRICDFAVNNLHVVGYSKAIDEVMPLDQLRNHLHTIPEQPDYIPYITSYYNDRWGFCLSHNELHSLPEGDYRVVIRSEHHAGELNYADLLIPGDSKQEILLSTYICHPSMANNELSGPVVVAALARWLMQQKQLRYSYRIVFTPETIGALTYICHNHEHLKKHVVAGYQVTTVGDDRAYSYIASPYGDTVSDLVAREVMTDRGIDYRHYSYLHRGSDERQYCAPNLRLPIASVCRTKYGEYPEYHTSADNLIDVVTPAGLQGAYDVYLDCIRKLETMHEIPRWQAPQPVPGCPVNRHVGEPQLGRRNLYRSTGHKGHCADSRLLINLLAYCDGSNTIDELAELTETALEKCQQAIDTLLHHDLVFLYETG